MMYFRVRHCHINNHFLWSDRMLFSLVSACVFIFLSFSGDVNLIFHLCCWEPTPFLGLFDTTTRGF